MDKFNVVIFHIGDSFKLDIYKKCLDSIRREFKDDNIIIFSSLDEIFEKYPGLKEEFYSYDKFFELIDNNLYYSLDLMRLLLAKRIPNMMYIDSDIYLPKNSNLKQVILKNIPEKCTFLSLDIGHHFFYCKKFPPSLGEWIDKAFAGGLYYSDDMAVDRYDGFYTESTQMLDKKIVPPFIHFKGLVHIKNGLLKKIFIINECDSIEDLNKIAYDDTAILYNNIFYHNYTGWVHQPLYNLNLSESEISLDDILNVMPIKCKVYRIKTLDNIRKIISTN
ncbi:MAG: hypothetical protein IKK93_07205 [Campylobacter sp.]|nr:hypothetical protein [Campylobacter sp.]